MKQIGFLHVREVDAIRYPIYENDDAMFVKVRNVEININLKNWTKGKLQIILSKKSSYVDFIEEYDSDEFPENIFVNGETIKNDNIIKITKEQKSILRH